MEAFIIIEVLLLFLTYTQTRRNRLGYFVICCIILFVINGLHCGLYSDYFNYLKTFFGEGGYGLIDVKGGYELEPTYMYYCKFLRLFGMTKATYIIGTCLMFGIPLMWLTWKNSVCPPLTMFLLFTFYAGWLYLLYLVCHRQMVATTFMFWAFIVYQSRLRFKGVLSVVLLWIALNGHSSSYFVIPVLLVVYFWKVEFSKKFYMAVCLVTMVLGGLVSSLFTGMLSGLFAAIGDAEETARTAAYVSSSGGGYRGVMFQRLVVMTFTTCTMLYYSTKEEANTFYMKLWVVATAAYNLLSVVPNIDRMTMAFVLLGITGAIPAAFMKKRSMCRWWVLAVMIANWIFAIRYYTLGMMYPFHFMWEDAVLVT